MRRCAFRAVEGKGLSIAYHAFGVIWIRNLLQFAPGAAGGSLFYSACALRRSVRAVPSTRWAGSQGLPGPSEPITMTNLMACAEQSQGLERNPPRRKERATALSGSRVAFPSTCRSGQCLDIIEIGESAN